MSGRTSSPLPDKQDILFGNVSLNDLLNGVVLDEVDLDLLLSTVHKVEVEENSQTLKDEPVVVNEPLESPGNSTWPNPLNDTDCDRSTDMFTDRCYLVCYTNVLRWIAKIG